MNASLLENSIQAYDEALQARQEALDKACDDAEKKAMRELTFDTLLEALAELPYHEKAKELRKASVCQGTQLFADTFVALFRQKTEQTLKQAAEHAQQITHWKALKRHLTLNSGGESNDHF